MKYTIYNEDINQINTECLVIFSKTSDIETFNFDLLTKSLSNYVKEVFAGKHFCGKYKESFFSYVTSNKNNIKYLLMIGLGEDDRLDKDKLSTLIKIFIDEIKKKKIEKISLNLSDLLIAKKEKNNIFEKKYIYEQVVKSIEYNFYDFSYYKSNKKDEQTIKEINFILKEKNRPRVR